MVNDSAILVDEMQSICMCVSLCIELYEWLEMNLCGQHDDIK